MLFTAHHISVTLEGDKGSFAAVDDVSLELNTGEIIDVIGPSGAGKSTLLHAFGMQVVSWGGNMFLKDRSSNEFTAQQWRRRVALVQQKPILVTGSVEDNLLLPWTLKSFEDEPAPDRGILTEALGAARLSDIALERSIDKLSVGQQARVAFLRTLLTVPDVLLLDEVDAALDDASAVAIGEMTSAYAQEAHGVIRVRHRTDDGRASQRIRMQSGRIVDRIDDMQSAGVVGMDDAESDDLQSVESRDTRSAEVVR